MVEHETLNLRVVGSSQTLGDLWLQGQALYFLTRQNVKPQLDNEGVLIIKWLFKHVQCFLIRDHFSEFQEPDQTSCRQLPTEIHRPLQSSWKNKKIAQHTIECQNAHFHHWQPVSTNFSTIIDQSMMFDFSRVTSSVLNSGQNFNKEPSSRGLPFLWLVTLLKKTV